MANRPTLLFVLMLFLAVTAAFAQSPPPVVQNWAGWAQCLIAIEAPGYSHGETHRWEITGAGTRQTNVEIYPATWTVTGAGSLQRRGRTLVPEQWSGKGTLTNVEIGFTRHLDRITFQRWSGAGPARGAFTGSETRPSMDVQQWAFPAGQDSLTSTRISGSNTSTFNGAVGPLAPADAKGTATCTWDFGPVVTSPSTVPPAPDGTATAGGGNTLETTALPAVTADLTAGPPPTMYYAAGPWTSATATTVGGPNPSFADGIVRYRFWVTNRGPGTVTGAIVRLPATAGLSKTRVQCSGLETDVPIPQAESGFVIPSLPPNTNGQVAVVIEVTATVTGTSSPTMNPTATVTAPAGVTDPDPGNNSHTLTFTAGIASLQIAIAATDPTATNSLVPVVSRPAGGTAHYLVQVTNHGPTAANGAIVTIPAATGLVSSTYLCSGPQGMQSANSTPAPLLSPFAIQSIPAGSWVNCTITARVTGPVGSNASLTVAVAAPTGIHDPTPGNNTATDTLPIR
jgi:uncharacterized repeat protein (TIGR01451 family)